VRLGVFIPEGSRPTNGQGTYQQGLLAGLLAQDRHQVVVLIGEHDAAPMIPTPHELVRIPRPRRRLFSVSTFDVFAEGAGTLAARRARLDGLVANAQFAMPRPPGVPRIVVLFEAAFAEPSQWGTYPAMTQRQWIRVTKRNLRHAFSVICLTEHGRSETIRNFGVPAERIGVAPPALVPIPVADHSRYRPPGRYVLVVGWFHPRKDVTLALAAWRRAVERGLDADLVLAGTEGPVDHRHGTMGRRILDTVGHALARRVHFTGLLPRDELGALYRDAAALLMTSRHEGFGIPAIEAFSFGVPVVAVARTSLTEVVSPVGSVVAADPEALAAALVEVCTHNRGHDVRRAYAATFTPARQVEPILAAADRIATR